MRISILMSIYWKEKPHFFNEAMISIWDNQTLKPNEIVLVEDGRLTDELYNTISFWENKLNSILKIVPLPYNQGLTKALNIGIKHCTGEFIARMDTDDHSAPCRFEKQIRFLKDNLDIDVIGGSIQEFSVNSDNVFIRRYPKSIEHIKKFIVKASPMAHPTVIFRRSIFDNGIHYNEKYRTSQDIDLWYTLLKLNYKISNIDEVIYYLRVSGDFFERRSTKKALNEFKIYWNGIISLYGISFKLIYPILRLIFRFMPRVLIQFLYSSSIRRLMLN
jgi:glycosyltransferase involved in cell wall biosynthesis